MKAPSASRTPAPSRQPPSPVARFAVQRCSCGSGAKDEECEECRAEAVQARSLGGAAPRVGRVVDARAVGRRLAGGGRPLPAGLRRPMERFFGRDLAGVRVHADDRSGRLARALSAEAFTVGDHVVFGAGAWRPGEAAGRALVAHELRHVLQQRGGLSGEIVRRGIGRAGDSWEREAEEAARELARSEAREGGPPEASGEAGERGAWEPAPPAGGAPATARPSAAGGAVAAALRTGEPFRPPPGGPGRPLEPPVRSAMEQRLGHQFGRIRIHDGAAAAVAAEQVGARAFTWGQGIWFGRGEYRPESAAGSRLLAHELVHTRQQERIGPRLQRVPIHGGDPGRLEEEAERLAGGGGQGAARGAGAGTGRGGARSVRRPAPPRGTDPAVCIEPLCDRVAAPPVPTSEAAARRRSQDFQADALACLAAGAAASNASHHAAIRAEAEDELRQAVRDLEADLPARARRRGGLRDWLAGLGDLCRRQRREIGIEFYYNVVFEQSGQPWGFHPAEWGSLEGALAALPEEATWTNPLLLRFRRAECHPDDVDPGTGACRILRTIGGEADPSTGRITIFRTGLGSQPMGRSRDTGVSTTAQVLRHEVGHVVIEQVPQAERDVFFTLMGWRDFSWAWVTARTSPHATWTAERAALRTELGMSEDQLDAWLAGLRQDVPVVVGPNVYTRGRHHLSRVRRDALPAGRAFEYARTARGEYLAELYALAVSAPEFLHDALPADQAAWLRRVVFGTPSTPGELAREVALAEPLQSRFLAAAAWLFTWPQIEALLARLTAGQAGGGELG